MRGMTTHRSFQRDVYTAAAVGLLLAMSLFNGYIAVGIAIGLLALGLVLFPELRGVGSIAAVAGVAAAVAIVLLRTLR